MLLLLATLLPTAFGGGDTASFKLTTIPTLPGGPSIAPRFVGLSIEVGSAPSTFNAGGLGGTPRRSLALLLNALRTAAGDAQGANVRVGGNSADESAYVPSGPLPANITYRITDADLRAYAAAVSAWNGTITLDTQLRHADQPALDAAHVRAALPILGAALEKVELGNEPDLFFENGIRPPSYGYSDGEGALSNHPSPSPLPAYPRARAHLLAPLLHLLPRRARRRVRLWPRERRGAAPPAPHNDPRRHVGQHPLGRQL